jgi:hypothetical protein
VFFFPGSGNNNCITLSYLLLLLVNVLLFYQLIGALQTSLSEEIVSMLARPGLK